MKRPSKFYAPMNSSSSRLKRTASGLLILTAASALQGGCTPPSLTQALSNIDNVEQLLKAIPADPKDPPGASLVMMELPRIKARYCLKRAIETYKNSMWNTGLDTAMLVIAGVGGGAGTSMGAAAAAMNDTDSSRRNVGIASVTTLAAAGAVLGLRAALNLSDVGRAQKIAAARNVNAAISILERYALVDDPKDAGDDAFVTCRDEDIHIANALPGAKSAEPIESLLTKSKIDKAEKESSAAVAEKNLVTIQAAAEDAKKKVAALQESIQSIVKSTKGTPSPELKQAEKDLEAAKATQAELTARAKEAADTARLEVARKQVATAQADVMEKKAAVIAAGGQLRRAVFFLTGSDIHLAQTLLSGHLDALSTSRQALTVAQEALNKLLYPTPKPAAAGNPS